jgi:isoleucyl-tRNA synthetase
LVWKVTDEWYIAMDKVDPTDEKGRTLRQKMIASADKISWKPEFGHDREMDWLNNMHDWLISKKNRYWGLALPIWVCDECGEFIVVGGKDELKEKSSEGWDKFEGHTPHKPFIDEVKIKHSCGGTMSRIGDVGNPWLDAGIVPFSTLVDPETGKVSYTSDKKYWEEWFPADFITESFPGQFKNWFYSLIAMSTVLEDTNPFNSVLGFASMLGEDGRAMHKSWGNSIEFNEGADKIGVDVMRWAFVRHNPERNLLFGYKTTAETKRLFHMLLWNSYRFFANYAALENWEAKIEFDRVPSKLDLWILGRLNQVVLEVEDGLDKFDAFSSTAAIEGFVSDLSTWYIRRSRDRVGPSASNMEDKEVCYRTLRTIFDVLSRVLMPFTPFLADMIYTNVTGEESVHLAEWPEVNTPEVIDSKLIENMSLVRKICEMGHSIRKIKTVAVKQPLAAVIILGPKTGLEDETELLQLIKEELNVESVQFKDAKEFAVDLDLVLTPELIGKGKIREVVRSIQEARKLAGCRMDEVVSVFLPDWPVQYEKEIKQKTLVKNIEKGEEIKIIRLA